jgi:hypothetical protein
MRQFPILCAATFALCLTAAPCHAQSRPTGANAIDNYERRLAAYEQAHRAYAKLADAYWDAIAEKRRTRNAKRRQHIQITIDDYVLTQPPIYSGPPRPMNPKEIRPPAPEKPPIPVVANFLEFASTEFGFAPELPRDDVEFKQAYARAAAAAGLNREQVVGVYAFETGGNGSYGTQAGVTATHPRAISPALGYNQLLSTNTVSLLAEYGDRYIATLHLKAVLKRGDARRLMERKVEALRRMIAFCRSVPNRWSDQDRLAKNTPGGWGVHAVLLDSDIGPLLQVQKLADSLQFARSKGFKGTLKPAELELMNLTGDGNGFDMVSMPQAIRERVPTANFFQRQGYERNPIARRTKVVANLVADIAGKMARASQAVGARDLAAAFGDPKNL